MNKTAQCMIKAAQLRAQADKLEKVALLLDGSYEITGLDLGLGAGALGLLGGSAYGVNKLIQRRAAAAAVAEAAEAAARKSMLLKGALELGDVGVIGGGGAYGANKLLNRYGIKDKLKNLYAAHFLSGLRSGIEGGMGLRSSLANSFKGGVIGGLANKGVAGAVPTP